MNKTSPLLAPLIERLRGEKDLKLVAEKAQIKYPYLVHIRSGRRKNPKIEILERLCQHYQISLIDENDEFNFRAPVFSDGGKNIPFENRINNAPVEKDGQREAMLKIFKKDYLGAMADILQLMQNDQPPKFTKD